MQRETTGNSKLFTQQRLYDNEQRILALEKELAQKLASSERAKVVQNTRREAEFYKQIQDIKGQIELLKLENIGLKDGTIHPLEEFLNGNLDETVDQMFNESEAQHFFSIPLNAVETTPELLPRLLRKMMISKTGNRVVFRAEGGSGKELVGISDNGNVTLERDTLFLNFGSADRAWEFFNKNRNRIVMFEVDEAYFQSLRSAAIPEYQSPKLDTPKLVDVTDADDQLMVPAKIVPELERFIVPGSGRVLIVRSSKP